MGFFLIGGQGRTAAKSANRAFPAEAISEAGEGAVDGGKGRLFEGALRPAFYRVQPVMLHRDPGG